VKIHHFNSTHGRQYAFCREPGKYQWHIWFGLHVWTIQFSCKCTACKLARRRKRWEKLTGQKVTDEQLLEAAKKLGNEHAVNQAITQERYREAQRKKNV
jgi:hypothetical protein